MKVALLFPGQGSQYVGMGKRIFEEHSTIAKEVFEEASEALQFDLKKLCLEGPGETLSKTEYAQPALLAVSWAMTKIYFQEIGVPPAYLAGHSLGEYSALVCSGVIEFSDGISLVHKRGQLMQDCVKVDEGLMASISDIDYISVLKIKNKYDHVSVACYNSPLQTVISGSRAKVIEFMSDILKVGAKVKSLDVSVPSHCYFMKKAANSLQCILSHVEYGNFKWPVISNATALPYEESQIIPTLIKQMTNPVKWFQSINYAIEKGVSVFIEVGPKTTLKKLIQEISVVHPSFSTDLSKDISDIVSTTNHYIKNAISKCFALAVSAQNFNYDSEEYLNGVILHCRRLKELLNNEKNDIQVLNEAYKVLKNILETKKLPPQHMKERLGEVESIELNY